MGLKQIKDTERIIFLKKFIEEVLITISEKHFIRKKIEEEKIRQKYVKSISSDKHLKEIAYADILPSMKYSEKRQEEPKRKLIFHRAKIPEKIPVQNLRKPAPRQPAHPFQQTAQPIRFKTSPQKFTDPLEKIEPLLRDNAVQLIECSGPGKNLVIKRINKMQVTKITLTQPETKNIINYFANQARIPIIGGILKAAVGNMVISAVDSDFVGSRFIINKSTPYSLIEDVEPNRRE